MAKRKTKRQLQVPGTETEAVKEVDKAAEKYVAVRDERMELTTKEREAKEELLAAMKKHSLTTYRDDGAVPPLLVTVVPGDEDVKVKRVKDLDEEPEEDAA